MKKTLPELQYVRLLAMYNKLNARLNRHFTLGRFAQFSKAQQHKLISRIERIKAQLLRMERGLKLAGSALAIGVALYSTDAHAQFAAQGSEFQVNTHTSETQGSPSIARDADGDFVVVWVSALQDGSQDGVYAQRYNASGVAQGSEFRVNTVTTSSQRFPQVAMDADGDFVVVWQSPDGSGDGIYAQRYNASGVAQGTEFRINTTTYAYQQNPSIAMDNDGDFVVAWRSYTNSSSYEDIYAQRYNASGVAQGSEFMVNTQTDYYQYNPSVAMDADGDFVVVWKSPDGSGDGIYAQRYNASGVAQGSEFRVNTYTSSSQYRQKVAMDADGDFVVVWQSYDQDGDSYGIYAQRYNASGVAQGSEFRVNTSTYNGQERPSISMDSDGDFVIAWQGRDISGNADIFIQRYLSTGAAEGTELMVNTYTTGSQLSPAVAMDVNGNFVVAWQENNGQDGQFGGIFAQRYSGGFPITTGAFSAEVLSALQLYPNPAQDEVFVSLEGEANIKVLDLSGQLIKQTETSNQRFSVAGLQAGVYLIEITQGEAKAMKKLVVK